MAVRLARELHPDVILMDIRMPDMSGDEATRLIVEDEPAARILILTVASDEETIADAVRAGACGYIMKDSPLDEVVAGARAAAHGNAWLSTRAAVALLERVRREQPTPEDCSASLDVLTSRERDVLRSLTLGHENAEIAAQLGISPRTAKNHVSSILAKLQLDNRVQAAVFAVKHGLV
jgi:DNA-binding NarL/FixJ family response regulator